MHVLACCNYRLLSTQEPDEGEDGASVAGVAGHAAALEVAGVRPALAAAAADPARRGPFLAAWALLLAHMQGAPLEPRRRLAAELHSIDGCAWRPEGWPL